MVFLRSCNMNALILLRGGTKNQYCTMLQYVLYQDTKTVNLSVFQCRVLQSNYKTIIYASKCFISMYCLIVSRNRYQNPVLTDCRDKLLKTVVLISSDVTGSALHTENTSYLFGLHKHYLASFISSTPFVICNKMKTFVSNAFSLFPIQKRQLSL